MKRFLIFICLSLLSMPLLAERRGSRIEVEKFDGTKVSGELLAVHGYTIMLLDDMSNGVFISVAEVKTIKVKRQLKILEGLGLGLSSGIGFATTMTFMKWLHFGGSISEYYKGYGFTKELLPRFSIYGIVLGGALSLIGGTNIKLDVKDYMLFPWSDSPDIDYDKFVLTLRQFARERF